MMKSILITGCNRGLGLGLVKHLATSKTPPLPLPPENIFATCRDASRATELCAVAKQAGNVRVIEIDVTDTKNYAKIVQIVKETVGGAGLNVLFNNAGVSSKFTRLGLVKEQQLTEAFHVNAIAPILLSKALLPLLKMASNNSEDKSRMSINRAAIVNMTSILGSITENDQGGFYPYRCSKSALNAATKSMSIDLKDDGILVTCLHPGWVRTDMGGSNAPMDVASSVSRIFQTLSSLSNEDSGRFIQYDGGTLPW